MSGPFTYKIKGARWLRKYTAPSASPVYAAASDAQNIADTLCDVPWTRADSDGPAMFPQHDAKALDANPGNRDLFDAAAFCAEHVNGAHKVYANAAFYLFALPSAAQGKTLSSVKVHLASDPYNEFGARVAVHLLSSPGLPTDCGTVRTGVAHADGQMPRTVQTVDGVAYWYGASGDVTVALPQNSVTTAYLGVFVGLENYARARGDWIEGASYIRNSVEIATADKITGWTSGSTETIDCSDKGPAVLLAGGSSPTWLQPLPTVNVTDEPPDLPEDAELVETFFTGMQTTRAARTYVKNTTLGGRTISGNLVITMSGLTPQSVSWGGYPLTCDAPATRQYWSRSGPYAGGGGDTGTLYITVHCWATSVSGSLGTARLHFEARLRYTGAYDDDGTTHSNDDSKLNIYQAFDVDNYYVMLRLLGGVPSAADLCDAPDESGRRNLEATITGDASPWTVTVDGTAYTVTKSGQTVTMKQGTTTLGTWQSAYSGTVSFFDASVALRLPGETANAAVRNYGLAAAVGDFTHAVATFEAGTQPPDGELLGRLARMSRATTGEMLYLHPESGALADELDVLRPVPRFWRAASDPTGQTACQPGLSVWYRRPAASTAAVGFAYRDATVAVTKVSNPAFLQLALLALRAPSAFASRLVLKNVGQTAVHNGFVLRFVAWRCPAEQWDGSNGFAMAAMASMPSVYRSDGPSEVSWSVDCTGALLRFDVRNMTAERIGVSQTVTGDIAANTQIAIPLVAPVGAGDVVLIAPEVLGFEDGTGDASVYFGRQDDPAGTGENSAASHNYAWARYPENLGWFPSVTGE